MKNFIKNYKKLKLDNSEMLDLIIQKDCEIKHLKEHIKNGKYNCVFAVVEVDGNYYGSRDVVKVFKYKKDAEKFIKFHPYVLEIDEHELI